MTPDLALSADERYRLDVQGYLVRPDALDPHLLEAARRWIERRGLAAPGPSVAQQRFGGLLDEPCVWDDLLDHGAAIGPLRELLGDTLRLDHAYGIYMAPGTAGLGLHGGGTPFDPSQYWLVRDGRTYAGLVGAMWGIGECGVGDGGFCCIPGSHKAAHPLPPGGDAAQALLVEVPLPAGALLLFSEALTHGTLPWRGRDQRRVVVYKYSPGHLAWAPPEPEHAAVHRTFAAGDRRGALLRMPSVAAGRSLADYDATR